MQITETLLEPLQDGLPRISRYDEFLRVTGEKDSPEMFIIWTQAAYTAMQKPKGSC